MFRISMMETVFAIAGDAIGEVISFCLRVLRRMCCEVIRATALAYHTVLAAFDSHESSLSIKNGESNETKRNITKRNGSFFFQNVE